MNNKIKMGVVEVDGLRIGDQVGDGRVIGFREVNGAWKVDVIECGDEGWTGDIEEITNIGDVTI